MSAGSYADFFRSLGAVESGDNYAYVSPAGYLGYYQFAEETLQSAGFYAGDGNTGVRDFSGAWTPLAASFGVDDKASFLAHPAAQDAAATAWFQQVFADLEGLDLVKYEGQTLNGFALTPSALLGGAHLVGAPALKAYLDSGGVSVPHDGAGMSVVDYMGRVTGYDTPFAFAHDGPATLAGGSGSDALHGWAGGDSLSGGGGSDTILGMDGSDTVAGGAGADMLAGNKGADSVDGGAGGADTLFGGQGDDRLAAHGAGAYLNGNLGADTLDGGPGGGELHGGQANDVLHGGAGGDQLYGDLGSDTLGGGGGADVFHIARGGGHDLVLDFSAADGDRVQVDGGAHATVAQLGADVVVTLDSGDQLTLAGVQRASLGDGWLV
jgi:Ca2+-binding RTX toxin-like protein